jgi:hypothetical protein
MVVCHQHTIALCTAIVFTLQDPPIALMELGGRDTRGLGHMAAALSLAAALVVAEAHGQKVGVCCRIAQMRLRGLI